MTYVATAAPLAIGPASGVKLFDAVIGHYVQAPPSSNVPIGSPREPGFMKSTSVSNRRGQHAASSYRRSSA